MPRPDIANLGLAYRRIPIMAFGRDILLDMCIIFQRLGELPNIASPPIGTTTPDNQALQRFFYDYTTDYGIFSWLALALITSDLPISQDQSFLEDRKDYLGTETLVDGDPKAVHAECLSEFAGMNLLSDGREFIFKTKTPSLGDIEAIWPTLFTAGMDVCFPRTNSMRQSTPTSMHGTNVSRLLSLLLRRNKASSLLLTVTMPSKQSPVPSTTTRNWRCCRFQC